VIYSSDHAAPVISDVLADLSTSSYIIDNKTAPRSAVDASRLITHRSVFAAQQQQSTQH